MLMIVQCALKKFQSNGVGRERVQYMGIHWNGEGTGSIMAERLGMRCNIIGSGTRGGDEVQKVLIGGDRIRFRPHVTL